MSAYATALSIAYLLGSIPFGYILVRTFRQQDIRETGSGNIGATNVLRSGGKGLGVATLLLDCGKGYAAVIIAHYLAVRAGLAHPFQLAALAAAVATFAHIFPIWLDFKGGKGVATGLGVFLALQPQVAVCGIVVFSVVLLLFRYVSLASIIAAGLFPIFSFLFYRPRMTPLVFACLVFIPLLIIAKHHQNIRRLLNGTEHSFGRKRHTL